jgi:DNA-binding PadR family transcriptional regulator
MTTRISRELTTLEYMLLGVLSMEPQSGYSINTTLQNGIYRWKASPGATYPALKRLEKNGIIDGEIQVVTETQARKVYHLTAQGEELLDHWIAAPLTEHELSEEHNIMLVKFLFAESRFTRDQVLAFLYEYEKRMEVFDSKLRIMYQFVKDAASTHQKLIYRSIAMDRITHRRWLKNARQALLDKTRESQNSEDAFASALEALVSP